MALFRALESARPASSRLFNDPFAQSFLSPSLRVVTYLARVPLLDQMIPRLIDRTWPGARTSGVARTRLIDDLLTSALQEGIDQVVILGAGFDCRAYRIPGIERTRVFEVDHPDTLAHKLKRLRRVLGQVPAHVAFAEADFNLQTLEDVMESVGFDAHRLTFFIWEGVTNYLTPEAVDSTLRFIGTAERGSRLLFTYVHQDVLNNPKSFEGTERLVRTLRQSSEPWTFGLDPAEICGYLEARGLQLIDDLGSVEYRARYMNLDEHNLKGYEFYRAAFARVNPIG